MRKIAAGVELVGVDGGAAHRARLIVVQEVVTLNNRQVAARTVCQ